MSRLRRQCRLALFGSVTSLAVFILCACGSSIASPGVSSSASRGAPPSSMPRKFKFRTIVNPADRTFNEALGINDARTVAGFYGSGAAGHPNQGYTAVPGFSKNDFTSEDFPGAVQTQVAAINGSGDTAGVWMGSSGPIQSFIDWNGTYTSYSDPDSAGATEILGLNDSGIAVGFYVDSSSVRHAFMLDRATGVFTSINPPYATNVTAAGINDGGDIVGYYFSGDENIGFLEKNGAYTTLYGSGALSIMPLGINVHDAIVGTYLDGSNKSHGFLLQDPLKDPQWSTIDAPKGAYGTYLNGINDRLNMVGYYVDSSINTIGLLVERKKM